MLAPKLLLISSFLVSLGDSFPFHWHLFARHAIPQEWEDVFDSSDLTTTPSSSFESSGQQTSSTIGFSTAITEASNSIASGTGATRATATSSHATPTETGSLTTTLDLTTGRTGTASTAASETTPSSESTAASGTTAASDTASASPIPWNFDSSYDGDALVTRSGISSSGAYYSKDNWEYRQVNKWLAEYAVRHNLDPTNFFYSLYLTEAFGEDNQQVCGLSPTGNACEGGVIYTGTTTPFQLTNDKFNANMVRQAIHNAWIWWHALWEAVGDAAEQVQPAISEMVLGLDTPAKVQKSQVLQEIWNFVQFALVLIPEEAVLEFVAESLVKSTIKSYEESSVLGAFISEDAAQKMVDATTKDLNKYYKYGRDKIYKNTKDFLAAGAKDMDDGGDDKEDDHTAEISSYQLDANDFAESVRSFLSTTWDAILDNGTAAGGLLDHLSSGDYLDIVAGYTSSGGDDHGDGSYQNAVDQYYTYLIERTMTQVLQDHRVKIIKRGSYPDVNTCLDAFNENAVKWATVNGHGCFADTDNAGRYSQYFPFKPGAQTLDLATYDGAQALLGSTWGHFSFLGPDFYYGTVQCTAANSLYQAFGTTDETALEGSLEPQYTNPSVPSGDTSTALAATDTTCAFSAPACNYEDNSFQLACTNYKAAMKNKVYALNPSFVHVDDDNGGCNDRDLLYFCLVGLEQGTDGGPTMDVIAQAYVDAARQLGIGNWGGLGGFSLWEDNHPEGSDSNIHN